MTVAVPRHVPAMMMVAHHVAMAMMAVPHMVMAVHALHPHRHYVLGGAHGTRQSGRRRGRGREASRSERRGDGGRDQGHPHRVSSRSCSMAVPAHRCSRVRPWVPGTAMLLVRFRRQVTPPTGVAKGTFMPGARQVRRRGSCGTGRAPRSYSPGRDASRGRPAVTRPVRAGGGRRQEVEPLVGAGRGPYRRTAHETLRPGKMIALGRRAFRELPVEPGVGRGPDPDDPGLLRCRPACRQPHAQGRRQHPHLAYHSYQAVGSDTRKANRARSEPSGRTYPQQLGGAPTSDVSKNSMPCRCRYAMHAASCRPPGPSGARCLRSSRS